MCLRCADKGQSQDYTDLSLSAPSLPHPGAHPPSPTQENPSLGRWRDQKALKGGSGLPWCLSAEAQRAPPTLREK